MREKEKKKGFKKRLSSVVLALAMVVALIPMNSMTAYADDPPTQPTSFNVPVSKANGTPDFSGTVGEANTWYFQTDDQSTSQSGNERISFFASDENSKGYDEIYQSTIIILADEDLNSWVDSSTPLPNGVSLKKSYNLSNNIGEHLDRLYAWFKFEGTPLEQSSAPLPKINIPKEILEFTTDGGNTWYHATSDIQIDLSLSLGNWSITSNSSHEHEWEYSLVGTDTIKAHCKAEGHEGDDVNITLSANSTNYSGSPATITIGTSEQRTAWTTAGLTVPEASALTYTTSTGGSLGEAPTTAGSYIAKLSVGGATAEVSFTIVDTHTHNSSAYGSNGTQHWTKCTDDNDNNGTPVNHTWSEGVCSVCSYTCTHGGETTGTCSTCGKSLGSEPEGTPEPTPAPAPDMATTNIGGLAYNTWEDIVANTPALTVEKLHEVNSNNEDLLHVNIYGKVDKIIPAEAIEALDKSPIRGLHVFVGESDAITFLNEYDYTNYTSMSFKHEDVVEENSRVIDFTTKGKINATVMFHTLIAPNVKAKVYKVVDGKEVEIATLSSNENGGFCFLIDELAKYVIKY